ncbi:MAG TPA: hypothetical protein DIC34_21180 [Treponema sp.]|nr:hypothetical protein [Treponema sp.]
MATIEDLVGVSGFSRSTVFRFLAGKVVRPAARDAILAAVRETGYGIAGARTGAGAGIPDRSDAAILLSVPAGFEGFRGFAEAAEGIMRRAGEAGLPVVFDEAHARGKRLAVVCLGRNRADEDGELARRKALSEPLVFVNRMIEEDDASWASVDFRAAAAEAAGRLADAGCRRIACWADAEGRRADTDKLDGLRAWAARSGLVPGTAVPRIVILTPADGGVEPAAERVLSGPDRPDGWLAVSDEIAMRVIRTALSLGLRVPGDLSVIGMNDTEGAAYFSPPLTSVRVPFRECGVAAVDIALRLLDNPSERFVRILLRHRLIERESCGPVIRRPGPNEIRT